MACKTVVVSVAVPMATADTSAPAVDGWHMPSYLVRVAQAHDVLRKAHDVLRFLSLIPDTELPMNP